MRKSRIGILTAGLCLVFFLTGAAQADYLVGLSHGTYKHRPEFSFEPQDTYHIYSAQNEWEPFQVLIWDDNGVNNVDVVITDFTGPGDDITTVEPYREHYLEVLPGQVSHTPPDPTMAGWWPDGLVPFVDHYDYEDRDGAPFDVQAEFAQAVFVDVFIPEDQTPGDYTATVTVTADGRADWTGTVILTVWDFALPNGMSLESSNYSYSRDGLCEYHQEHGATTDCEILHQRFMEEYARHRMSAHRWHKTPEYDWDDGTQTLTYHWDEWDDYHATYLDGTFYKPGFEMTTVNLPRSFGNPPSGLTQDEWEDLHWASWGQHFREQGWLDKLWCYLTDEPAANEYPGLVAKAARIHAADPGLQVFITEQYEPELEPAIDIWCPDEPMFSDSIPFMPKPYEYEQQRALGKKTWWYNCVSATIGFDYSDHMVDHESSYMRIWLWLTRRYGFTGILFWRIQYLWDRQDVWESMYSEKFLCNGDGTLYYPGIPDKIGGTTDIPLPSLRIKALREAMEDYEYFHILDEMGESDWVDDVTRTVAPKTYLWEHDPFVILDWRRKAAEKILGTLDEIAPDPPTAVTAVGQVEAVELSWTAPDDADLAGFDIWYSIYDGDRFFGGSVDADAIGATVVGLTANREHIFWVRAFDENGNRSDDSDPVTATPSAEDTGDDDTDEEPNPTLVEVSGISGGSDGDNADRENGDEDDNFTGCGGW